MHFQVILLHLSPRQDALSVCQCPDGEIGKRCGLRSRWSKILESSSLSSGTHCALNLQVLWFAGFFMPAEFMLNYNSSESYLLIWLDLILFFQLIPLSRQLMLLLHHRYTLMYILRMDYKSLSRSGSIYKVWYHPHHLVHQEGLMSHRLWCFLVLFW